MLGIWQLFMCSLGTIPDTFFAKRGNRLVNNMTKKVSNCVFMLCFLSDTHDHHYIVNYYLHNLQRRQADIRFDAIY